MAEHSYDLAKARDRRMGVVIHIDMFGEYRSPYRRELRNRFQLESWRWQRRQAEAHNDGAKLEFLDVLYEHIGLP